jgi:uncharacterized protein YgbK (DUF1537 family)
MPTSSTSLKSIRRDLNIAWKLLHHLADTLTRLATDMATLSESAETPALPASKQKRKDANTASNLRHKKTGASNKVARGLPDTSGDFFARHITRRKRTAPQIFQSVLDSLEHNISKEEAQILRNRLAVWLSNAVKSSSQGVSSTGTGRERHYFRT